MTKHIVPRHFFTYDFALTGQVLFPTSMRRFRTLINEVDVLESAESGVASPPSTS